MTKEFIMLLYITIMILIIFIWVSFKFIKLQKNLNKHINNENHLILKIHELKLEIDKLEKYAHNNSANI